MGTKYFEFKKKNIHLNIVEGEKKKICSPDEGLEPATLRLKVWCSTDWANRARSERKGTFSLLICKERIRNTIEKYRLVLMRSHSAIFCLIAIVVYVVKMHLMYYLDDKGKRVYTLKVSLRTDQTFVKVLKDFFNVISISWVSYFLSTCVEVTQIISLLYSQNDSKTIILLWFAEDRSFRPPDKVCSSRCCHLFPFL